MKICYSLVFAFVIFSAAAQSPVLTRAWVPTIGLQIEQYNIFEQNGIPPGPAGAAQTWNLTQYDTVNTWPVYYVTPSSALDGSTFPTATDCDEPQPGTGLGTFDIVTDSTYKIMGTVQPPPNHVVITFSTPEMIFPFPFTYGTTWADTATFSGTLSDNLSGTVTGIVYQADTVDGYGTLITPAGTYTDALRIKIMYTEIEQTFSLGQDLVDTAVDIRYKWVSPSHNGLVLAFIDHLAYCNCTSTGGDDGYYSTLLPTGITGVPGSPVYAWSIAPQPAPGHTTLSISSGISAYATITVCDLAGHEVMRLGTSLSEGKNEVVLNLPGIADGMYITTVNIGGEASSQKLVVSH